MSPPWNGDNWPRTVYDLYYNVMKSPQIKYSQKCGDKCLPRSAAFKMAAGRCISIFFIALRFVDVSWNIASIYEMEGGQVNEEKPSQDEWPLEKAEVGAKEILVTFFSESLWDLFPRGCKEKEFVIRFKVFAFFCMNYWSWL